MSGDDLGGLLIAVIILATFAAHLYYLIGAIYRRRWPFAVKIGGSFALYLVAIVVSFLFGVGLCAAGCPAALGLLLGLFYLGISIALVLRLRNSNRRLTQDSIQTPTN